MSEFLLEIITPEKQFLRKNAEAVTCDTLEGQVCVLKGHQTMIAALKDGKIKIKSGGEWKEIFSSDGFMEVRPDEVMIFAQFCEWPENIDAVREEQKHLEELDNLKKEQCIIEHRHNEIALARAMTRLKSKGSIE